MGGRASRGVAYDAQQELAWLDTGRGGVQLMRFQPLATPTPAVPLASLLPPAPRPVVQVQPRPQGLGSLAQEKLPALNSVQSQSYTQRQLETYFKVRPVTSGHHFKAFLSHFFLCYSSIIKWEVGKKEKMLRASEVGEESLETSWNLCMGPLEILWRSTASALAYL